MTSKKIVWFLASSPLEKPAVTCRKEHDLISEELSKNSSSINIELRPSLATTFRNFSDSLGKIKRDSENYLHFSGHSDIENILFEDENGFSHPVKFDRVLNLIKLHSAKIKCIIFNTCNSFDHAMKTSKYIPYAIGMRGKIDNTIAHNFAMSFYKLLNDEAVVIVAFEHSRLLIEEGEEIPHLFVNLNRKADRNLIELDLGFLEKIVKELKRSIVDKNNSVEGSVKMQVFLSEGLLKLVNILDKDRFELEQANAAQNLAISSIRVSLNKLCDLSDDLNKRFWQFKNHDKFIRKELTKLNNFVQLIVSRKETIEVNGNSPNINFLDNRSDSNMLDPGEPSSSPFRTKGNIIYMDFAKDNDPEEN